MGGEGTMMEMMIDVRDVRRVRDSDGKGKVRQSGYGKVQWMVVMLR